MKLYSYWRSSASYRVRIALNLKGLKPEIVPVNLLKSEQQDADYRKLNPQGLVPSLVDNGEAFSQSLAIMEYLEEKYPEPALLPQPPAARAKIRALMTAIACEVSPLGNLRVMGYLTNELKLTEEQKTAWLHQWMGKGFAAVEQMLAPMSGSFCYGSAPTLADCVLVPQVYNCERFKLDMTPYPTIARIAAHANTLPAFIAAHPSKQLDAA